MIKNNENNKSYIGQSIDIKNRWMRHKSELNNNNHINNHLQFAWNKYGEDCFSFIILEECPIESLDEREIFYIEKFNSRNEEIGYNIALGGNQISQDERVSNAISKAQKNNFSDPIKGKVLREKLSLVTKGKRLSCSHINKLKDINSKRIRSAEERAKLSNSLKGHYVSENTKKKIGNKARERNIGRHWFNNGEVECFTYECPEGFKIGRLPFSEECKSKISKSSKNKKNSEECKSKISKSKIGNKNPMFGIPNPNKGKIIINNNIKNLYIYPEELNIYIASGWKKGKVKK